MYKLIGTPKARPFRVVWAMEEMGLKYEIEPATPQSEGANAANPSGKVPALQVGDDVIVDSVAIVQFLADKHGQLTYPAGTIERAQQDSFTQFLNDEIDGALWTNARNTFVNPEDRRSGDIGDVLKWEFARSIKTLEQRLGDNAYLMGDMFTVPDIILTHCCGWARNAGFEIESDAIRAYVKRAIGRDGYKRADAIRSPK